MGGMKFDNIQQCGIRCKELGPMTSLLIAPSSSYEEVTHKAKQQFFASDVDKEAIHVPDVVRALKHMHSYC